MNKVRKIPMRTCIVTREKLPKSELIRIVKTPNGEVVVDLTSKLNGRGAYLKKDNLVFQKAKMSKVLNRHLETDVPDIIFEELEKLN